MDAEVSTHTFLTIIIEESVYFMSCKPILFLQLFLCGTHRIYFYFFSLTLRMSDNLPKRVQILGHPHILCITVREKRIICCQIFCDLLLKYAFEPIFNVMQLILVKIKYLSYYFNNENKLWLMYQTNRYGISFILYS